MREAVLNAIAHKDYSGGIPIQIKVFEDKIRIWNDGQLPHNWSVANLLANHPSHPNNPDIANAFFRAGMIESWSRGIEKIIHQCLMVGLPAPVFDTSNGGLEIEFSPLNKTVDKSSFIIYFRTLHNKGQAISISLIQSVQPLQAV